MSAHCVSNSERKNISAMGSSTSDVIFQAKERSLKTAKTQFCLNHVFLLLNIKNSAKIK